MLPHIKTIKNYSSHNNNTFSNDENQKNKNSQICSKCMDLQTKKALATLYNHNQILNKKLRPPNLCLTGYQQKRTLQSPPGTTHQTYS